MHSLHRVIPPNPKLLSPVTLPPVRQVSSQTKLTPRAISIPNPGTGNNALTTPPITETLNDDSIAAFWDYQFLFVSQRSETENPINLHVIEGSVPADFRSGTYYLAGPGLFSDDYGSTVHPLDGHGYLRAFDINGTTGEVKFTARYVKTEAQEEEHDPETDTWRFKYRGPFSVLRGGKKIGNTKVMKNVANTSVLKWGGRLLCLWEGGEPYEIESETLDTLGKFDMINGCGSLPDRREEVQENVDLRDLAARILKPVLYGVFKMPPKRLLSHYKVDAKRNRLLIISCNAEDMLLPRSNFTVYEYDSDFNLLEQRDFEIPDHLMIHDWAFTDTHYILFANRIKLNVIGSVGAISGLSPMISALSVNPNKSTSPIYLLPRFSNASGRDWRVPVEAPSQMWLLHVGNSYEVKDMEGNSEIHIHACSCSYQWFNFQKLFGYNWQSGKLDPSIMNLEQEDQSLPHLVQVSISLDASGGCQRCTVEPLSQWKNSADFPAINPSYSGYKNTYVYAATSSGYRKTLPHFPFDTVVKLDVLTKSVKTWTVGARRFIGEPIFVRRENEEDDGYLLVVEYAVSIQRCFLVVLDAKRIGEADALVARLEVPKELTFPLGFHGFWADGN